MAKHALQPAAVATPQNLPFAIGPQLFQGIPSTAPSLAALKQALQGGPAMQQFYFDQTLLYTFYETIGVELINNIDRFYPDTTADGQDLPMYYYGSELTDVTGKSRQVYIEVTPTLDHDVISGKTPPQGFDWNGVSYNIIGVITMPLTIDKQTNWEIVLPVGISGALGVGILSTLAWKVVLGPVMEAAVNMLKGCFRRVVADSAEEIGEDTALTISEGAAEDGAIEGAEAGTSTVSVALGATAAIGAVVLISVVFVAKWLSHISYHYLKVYNLTGYTLTWGLPYYSAGGIALAPTNGQKDQYSYTIAPTMDNKPPTGNPQLMSSEADFNFQSTNGFNGIGYVMSFVLTDPANGNAQVGSGLVLFDIPWADNSGGSNSLAVEFTPGIDATSAHTFWSNNNGKQKVTAAQANNDVAVVTATFDYLSGKHPGPDGVATGYNYNSLLVFAPPAA